MAIERRRPLPAGRYWIDVFQPNRAYWEIWSTAMKHAGRLTIEHTESFEATDGEETARDFVIFSTNAETIGWPDRIGSPTIAGKEIQSSADTVQRPDAPLEPLDALSETLGDVKQGAKTAVAVGVAIGVLALGFLFLRR
ncbi:MAG: hypothetical protein PHQ66_03945 [Candidatus Nanoarchaeia archaeon]|nr:hypothetical protein [Candidatus Nanoarchaeia archaeon]